MAGHGHSHGGHGEAELKIATRMGRVVAGAAVAVAVASVIGVVALWPTGAVPSSDATIAPTHGASIVRATIASVRPGRCDGTPADRLPDGSIPARVACPTVVVRLTSGPEEGTRRTVDVPASTARSGLAPGDRVDLARYPATAGVELTYAWLDFSRRLPLAVVVLAFVAVVLVVGRLRGLAALVGLGLGYVTILGFVVPALIRGENATLVALTGSVAIMSVVLYLAHGFSLKTATAHLATTLGLVLTAVAGPLVTSWAHLRGLNDGDSTVLVQLTGSSSLAGFVVAGIVISGLGVLNDVTISQASAVWELRGADPGAGPAVLFRRALRIGRDHLASTVYTLAFAYAGSALPTLILLRLYDEPLGQVVGSSAIAEEIVRTAVGGSCLVVAIPLTTALAVAVVTGASGKGGSRGRRRAR